MNKEREDIIQTFIQNYRDFGIKEPTILGECGVLGCTNTKIDYFGIHMCLPEEELKVLLEGIK